MDPNAFAGLNEQDSKEMMKMIEDMQMRDSLKMYNRLVERCFNTCVDSFRRKNLDSGEERCVTKCTEKFLKHSARVSVRFAELSAASGEAAMAQMAAAQKQ
uniref:Mitochondrial import inner membrane translocase subunit n=1 Tax=Pyramimonas obovata TaxID=1411642 RepID=A0A6T7VR93_9CHLO